jgi:hypothetical protein
MNKWELEFQNLTDLLKTTKDFKILSIIYKLLTNNNKKTFNLSYNKSNNNQR